jgi:hypothetical protein
MPGGKAIPASSPPTAATRTRPIQRASRVSGADWLDPAAAGVLTRAAGSSVSVWRAMSRGYVAAYRNSRVRRRGPQPLQPVKATDARSRSRPLHLQREPGTARRPSDRTRTRWVRCPGPLSTGRRADHISAGRSIDMSCRARSPRPAGVPVGACRACSGCRFGRTVWRKDSVTVLACATSCQPRRSGSFARFGQVLCPRRRFRRSAARVEFSLVGRKILATACRLFGRVVSG